MHFFSFDTLLVLFLGSFVVNAALTFKLRSNKGSQSLDYHYHLDTRPGKLFGVVIPNFLDVVTNSIFVVVGLAGVLECWLLFPSKTQMTKEEQLGWYVFFWSFFLVSIGSAYYHWRPNNWTLVWDRLPMTLGFMSIYYLCQKNFLPPHEISLIGNIALGAFSIFIWYLTLYWNKGSINNIPLNYLGNNDGSHLTRKAVQAKIAIASPQLYDQLLPYIIIQFYPIVCLSYMVVIWPAGADLQPTYMLPALVLYILAKVFETLDLVGESFYLHTMRGVISGHSLKHLSAGFATLSLMVYLIKAK